MKFEIPFYPKVRQFGHREICDILHGGEVVIQEKVDGSNFSFGYFPDSGGLVCLSRESRIYLDDPPNMFRQAVDHVRSVESALPPDVLFRCEYLRCKKHNVLDYQRCPENHLVLFEALLPTSAGVLYNVPERDVLESLASLAKIEVVPEFYRGSFESPEELFQWLDLFGIFRSESFLGGPLEGVVVKNYNRFTEEGSILTGKIVRPEFKECHRRVKRSEKPDKVAEIGLRFGGPARWQKAVQRLTEEGRIVGSTEDIPALLKRIHTDVTEECIDEIKEALWKSFKPAVFSGVRSGFVDWYKDKISKQSEIQPGGGEIL